MGKAVPRSEMSKADYSSGIGLIRKRKPTILQGDLRVHKIVYNVQRSEKPLCLVRWKTKPFHRRSRTKLTKRSEAKVRR